MSVFGCETFALAVTLLLLYAVVRWYRDRRDHFASQRAQEVYEKSRELFDRTGGRASYSEFKTVVPAPVDAVQYSDIRHIWRGGRMSAEAVERVL